MRTRTFFTVCTLILAIMVFGLAGTASAQGIAGTKHDFTNTGDNTGLGFNLLDTATGDFMCKPCHTPHNFTANADMPLANRNGSGASYTPYNSTSFDGGTVNVQGTDLICLSCHDGTIAMDQWGGGNTEQMNVNTPGYIGTNLASTHPVSFNYNVSAGADNGIKGTPTGSSKTYGDFMRCASCHDPHQGAGNVPFLRDSAGTLCQNCHLK